MYRVSGCLEYIHVRYSEPHGSREYHQVACQLVYGLSVTYLLPCQEVIRPRQVEHLPRAREP